MILYERIENILKKCRDEKITIHRYGEWVELRIHGLHPILSVRLIDDCIFRRHIISKFKNHFEETGVPILACGDSGCMYYSGPETYRTMAGSLEDNLCRVIRGGIVRDEMFLSTALRNLGNYYLHSIMESLDTQSEASIEFAKFMGFGTALFPRTDREVAGRYLLFRWLSLYLLYRNTSLFRNNPMLLPASGEPGEFLVEMWNRYYSHLENFSDMKDSIGNPSSVDIAMLSRWERLPAFTADIHWITGFAGGNPGFHQIPSIASFVEEDEMDILTSTSRFISDGSVAVFTPAFGLLALQVYMEKRSRGMEHREIINSMTIFTSPGAGEVFQSTILNLVGEGVPYRPKVVGTDVPPMKWGEFAALLKRNVMEKPFSTILMDWRGRNDTEHLFPLVDYLWDSTGSRIVLLVDMDERNMGASGVLLKRSRVEVIITHEHSNCAAFIITGRGTSSMNYTKLIRMKLPLERDMTDVIQNAENRLDSSMTLLNIPVRGARFYYYRDTTMWLIASLQGKLLRWGGPLLALVPGYIWKALAGHRWIPLRNLARIQPDPCQNTSRSKRPDLLLSTGKHGFELIEGIPETCTGIKGIQVKDRDRIPLIRWFLRSETARILYRIFGLENLPIPELPRHEGSPDRFFQGKDSPETNSRMAPAKKSPPISELVELLSGYLRGSEDPEKVLRERVFDRKLRSRILRAYSKKYGKPAEESKGSKLF